MAIRITRTNGVLLFPYNWRWSVIWSDSVSHSSSFNNVARNGYSFAWSIASKVLAYSTKSVRWCTHARGRVSLPSGPTWSCSTWRFKAFGNRTAICMLTEEQLGAAFPRSIFLFRSAKLSQITTVQRKLNVQSVTFRLVWHFNWHFRSTAIRQTLVNSSRCFYLYESNANQARPDRGWRAITNGLMVFPVGNFVNLSSHWRRTAITRWDNGAADRQINSRLNNFTIGTSKNVRSEMSVSLNCWHGLLTKDEIGGSSNWGFLDIQTFACQQPYSTRLGTLKACNAASKAFFEHKCQMFVVHPY